MKETIRKQGLNRLIILVVLIFRIVPAFSQLSIADSLKKERAAEIQDLLIHDRDNFQKWWYGWIAGYSAATLAQGGVYFAADNKSLKQDMALGAATTFLGVGGQLITPLIPYKQKKTTGNINKIVFDGNFNDPERYEQILSEIARREKEGRSWKTHAVAGVVNISSGLVTWKGFNRSFGEGLLNFALNTVITEAQIWTQPKRAISDYREYMNKYGGSSSLGEKKHEAEWMLTVLPGGVTLSLNF